MQVKRKLNTTLREIVGVLKALKLAKFVLRATFDAKQTSDVLSRAHPRLRSSLNTFNIFSIQTLNIFSPIPTPEKW